MKAQHIEKIKKRIKDVVLNYGNYSVQFSTDYALITMGDLQLENLDWRWVPNNMSVETVLKFDPNWWKFNRNLEKGSFHSIKYGLSGENTMSQYVPLYKLGTPYEQQLSILETEAKKMIQNGARFCKNGIEIIPEQKSLWRLTDSLAKKCRKAFVYQQNEIIENNEKHHIEYDNEALWKAGAKITPEILDILEGLFKEISR